MDHECQLSAAVSSVAGSAPLPATVVVPPELPFVEELPVQLQPSDVFERIAGLGHALFIESALQHPNFGRYSFLCADPFAWLTSRRGEVRLNGKLVEPHPGDPFRVLADQ